MLKRCFRHYGLSPSLRSAVERLALLCFQSYPCGYSTVPAKNFSFSQQEGALFLGVPQPLLAEALHYGALFGLVCGVVLSPSHAEFSLNPAYKRDLFFARLRLELRDKVFST